ncbi:MAG: HepT-like ribonuclease domain-containing protein [Pseudonocardiaceae bacterium]
MRNDRERLADILEAAEKIQSRADRGRDRFDAAARVSSDTTARYPAVPWRQVVGMRNRVVHDYFEVDLEICGLL